MNPMPSAVMPAVLMLVRSTVFNLWFYLGTLVFAIASLVPRALERWLPADWALHYGRRWCGFVLTGLRTICGTGWEVNGRENLPADGPALIVSMHQSAFDTMIWFGLVPWPCYVLKRELEWIPLFGPMLRRVAAIAVDRAAGAAALRAMLKETDAAFAAGRQVVIFPEGTRAAPGAAVPLQPGFLAIAGRSAVPVIPVTTDSGRFWGRRAFGKRPGTIRIDVHPPLPPGSPRAEIAARIEAIFAAERTRVVQGDALPAAIPARAA